MVTTVPAVRTVHAALLCGLIYSSSATSAVEMDRDMAALDRGKYFAALKGLQADAVGTGSEVRDGASLQTWRQMRVYSSVAYENVPEKPSAESAADREQGQAQNLSTVISLESKAKLLVFVGRSHVAESHQLQD
ncbi:MAG: hypothetical protein QOD42_2714 [Sphingomonadales bacterium]|nr:hypothetical protein [Sphingomonadales bacterium]